MRKPTSRRLFRRGGQFARGGASGMQPRPRPSRTEPAETPESVSASPPTARRLLLAGKEQTDPLRETLPQGRPRKQRGGLAAPLKTPRRAIADGRS